MGQQASSPLRTSAPGCQRVIGGTYPNRLPACFSSSGSAMASTRNSGCSRQNCSRISGPIPAGSPGVMARTGVAMRASSARVVLIGQADFDEGFVPELAQDGFDLLL